MNLDTFLKIKQKSLADEAIHIRKEKNKIRNNKYWFYKNLEDLSSKEGNIALDLWKTYQNLDEHNKNVVAVEARATNIARAYLKGKPYAWVEPTISKQTYHIPNYIANQPIYFYNEYGTTINRVIDIVTKYKSAKTYHYKISRDPGTTKQEVINWIAEHPQFKQMKEKLKGAV